MADPIEKVKAVFPTWKFIGMTIIAFIAINFALDALANFVPGVGATVSGFLSRPFSTIKAKFTKAPAGQ